MTREEYLNRELAIGPQSDNEFDIELFDFLIMRLLTITDEEFNRLYQLAEQKKKEYGVR